MKNEKFIENKSELIALYHQKKRENVILLEEKKLLFEKIRSIEEGGVPVEQAHQIMGKNFFGVEDAKKIFRLRPKKEESAKLAKVPFRKDLLIACKDTHILTAVFPLSISDIKRKFAKGEKIMRFSYTTYEKPAHESLAFQKLKEEKGKAEWQLIQKVVKKGKYFYPDDWSKLALAPNKDEEIPNPRIMVYFVVGLFFSGEKKIFGLNNFGLNNNPCWGYRVYCHSKYGWSGYFALTFLTHNSEGKRDNRISIDGCEMSFPNHWNIANLVMAKKKFGTYDFVVPD